MKFLKHPAFTTLGAPRSNSGSLWSANFVLPGHGQLKLQQHEYSMGDYRTVVAPTLEELDERCSALLFVYDAEIGKGGE